MQGIYFFLKATQKTQIPPRGKAGSMGQGADGQTAAGSRHPARARTAAVL